MISGIVHFVTPFHAFFFGYTGTPINRADRISFWAFDADVHSSPDPCLSAYAKD